MTISWLFLRALCNAMVKDSVMWSSLSVLLCLSTLYTSATADTDDSTLSSRQILPTTFRPPQVFENIHLLRNINLEKGYSRESINVVIGNIATTSQSEYYLPFNARIISKIGGLEVRDKKDPERAAFQAEVVEYDPYRYISSELCNWKVNTHQY